MFILEDIVEISLNKDDGIAFYPSQAVKTTEAIIVGLFCDPQDKTKDAAMVVELNNNYLDNLCSILTYQVITNFAYDKKYTFTSNASNFLGKKATWISLSALSPKQKTMLNTPIPIEQFYIKNYKTYGHHCKKCSSYNEYAEQNQSDGTYVCYNCRG